MIPAEMAEDSEKPRGPLKGRKDSGFFDQQSATGEQPTIFQAPPAFFAGVSRPR
jgi:hypothetical protein